MEQTTLFGSVHEHWLDMPDGSKESVPRAAVTNRKNDVHGHAVELRNEATMKNYLICLTDLESTARRAGYAACGTSCCTRREREVMVDYILELAAQRAMHCEQQCIAGRPLNTIGPDERGVVLVHAHDLYLKTSGPLQLHAVMNPVLLTRPALLQTEFECSPNPQNGRWLGSKYEGEKITTKWNWSLVGGQPWRTPASSQSWPVPLAHQFASMSPFNAVHVVPSYLEKK